MGRKVDLKYTLRRERREAEKAGTSGVASQRVKFERLAVRTLGGELCSVTVTGGYTSWSAKREIERATGIAVDEQRLIFRGRELADFDRLSSARLPLDPTTDGITLVRRNALQARWLKLVDHGESLSGAPPEIRADREVVLRAVRCVGYQLLHASPELRADRELALLAVRSSPLVLHELDAPLQGDREIVLAAVRNNGEALSHAASDLRADRELALLALKSSPRALGCLDAELRGDREIVLAAIRQKGIAINWAADDLRADREVLLAAVTQSSKPASFSRCCCCGLQFPDGLRADREIFLDMLRAGRLDMLKFAAPELLQDSDFVAAALATGAFDACDPAGAADLQPTRRGYRWLRAALPEELTVQGCWVWSCSASRLQALMDFTLRVRARGDAATVGREARLHARSRDALAAARRAAKRGAAAARRAAARPARRSPSPMAAELERAAGATATTHHGWSDRPHRTGRRTGKELRRTCPSRKGGRLHALAVEEEDWVLRV